MNIFKRAPWWQFWNPMSGLVGGLIHGALLTLAFVLGMVLSGWLP